MASSVSWSIRFMQTPTMPPLMWQTTKAYQILCCIGCTRTVDLDHVCERVHHKNILQVGHPGLGPPRGNTRVGVRIRAFFVRALVCGIGYARIAPTSVAGKPGHVPAPQPLREHKCPRARPPIGFLRGKVSVEALPWPAPIRMPWQPYAIFDKGWKNSPVSGIGWCATRIGG